MALQDPTKPNLYRFVDAPATPDPFYTEDYLTQHKGKETPIIVDNGSSHCRVGWSGESDPRLVFRNAIARSRGRRGESDYTCIGNDITNVETVRSSLRNQFDRNLISNFVYQEQLFDHAFSHLGLSGERCVQHPIVVTEPVCNPSYCRGLMSELLFEAYGVPSVAYGIDALFSAYQNYSKRGVLLRDAMVISSGQQATHLLPLVDCKFDARHCKRVNVGGVHVVSYLARLLQLKYPALQPHITLSRAQELLHTHGYLALDYAAELQEWVERRKDGDLKVIQLPYTQAAAMSMAADPQSKEAKDRERRQRAREQLLKLNQKKKEEKIASLELQLERLLAIQQQRELVDAEEYALILEEEGFEGHEALETATGTTQDGLEAEQEKLAALQRSRTEKVPTAEVAISEEWLQSLRERRRELLGRKRHREQRKQELGKRRSAASQNRMRMISLLADDPTGKKKQKEDTFGMNDDDWNVYRDISKTAGESDGERDESELTEIGKVLEKHDPGFMRLSTPQPFLATDMAAYYQVVLGVERCRVPEILFQPTMVGVDQGGVSSTMEYVLQTYPSGVQQRLVDNVFVTGGNTLFPNFGERLSVDLQAMRPYGSVFHVTTADNRLLDGWRGAATWADSLESRQSFISRAEYSENGADFFKEHLASNLRVSPGNTD